MATLYETNGNVTEVQPQKGRSFTYEELRSFVGGMVQIVPLPSGKSMVVHEEGKLIGLEKNEKASTYWQQEYPIDQYPLNNDELIVDPALVATDIELGEGEEEDN